MELHSTLSGADHSTADQESREPWVNDEVEIY